MNNQKGITLIALIITIAILIIISSVSLSTLSDNGIITKAKETKFRQELTQVKEELNLTKLEKQIFTDNVLDEMVNGTNPKLKQVLLEEIEDFSEQLKFEIIFWGQYDIGISQLSKDYVKNNSNAIFNEIVNGSDIIPNLYYIQNSTANEPKYIYDSNVDIVYKIKTEKIGSRKVNSIEELDYVARINKDKIEGRSSLLTKIGAEGESSIVEVSGIKCYSPDLTGLVLANTKAVYYEITEEKDGNGKNILGSGELEIPISEYLETKSITPNGYENYKFYDYENDMWANIKIKTNGVEGYFVWIPRYAYKINGAATDLIDIKFIDIENNDLTTGEKIDESAYIVHPSFTKNGKQLKGIWVGKYEPSSIANTVTTEEFYIPDLTGLDKENTYIEVYNETTDEFTETKLSEITNLREFAKNNKWYDYEKQIWANIKVVNNGLEAWFVWIPRYAYSLTDTVSSIKFVDLKGNPLDGTTLDSSYTVHPAFTKNGKELKGIWVGKYEPSTTADKVAITPTANVPNLKNLNVDTTYIEIYNTKTEEFREVSLRSVVKNKSDIKENTNEDGKFYTFEGTELKLDLKDNEVWYDYENKMWANIKVANDGLEAWFVWIPKYAYNLTDTTSSIIFLDGTSSNMGTNGEKIPDNYTEHSAFTKTDENGNTIKLTGIWSSKYEPSNK